MLEKIVYPLGMPKQEQDNESDIFETPKDVVHENVMALDRVHDRIDDYMQLTEAELEIVLNRISLCQELGKEIQWDLLGEILFPCDSTRQELLVNKKTSFDGHRRRTGTFESQYALLHERARAVLCMSYHDWNVASSHLWNQANKDESEEEIPDDSCDSFYEDSISSMCNGIQS
jgi:hypothetical protein